MTADTQSPPGYRRVWALAWPIILSNLSVPLVGAVDTAVMGHLPDPAYIGAVSLGATLFSVLFWSFGFLRMSTTGFVAQALGAGDGSEVRAILARALLLAAALAGALWLLQGPVATVAFAVVDGSEDVIAFTRTYFDVRIWSAPAAFANYVLLGTLIGLQRTRAVFAHQVALNGINVTLDLLFVPVLGLEVAGVATASVIAEYAAVGIGLVLVKRRLAELPGRLPPRAAVLAWSRMRPLLAVNANILVRTLCLVGSFFWFAASGARLGDVVLAANQVLMQLQFFLAYGLDGFAYAAEGLAGVAWGRRDRAYFAATVRTTTVSALGVAGVYAAVYATLGPLFITWMTDIEAVRASAIDYLPWMILAPLVSIWSFQLDGIFIGTTRTVEMRNAMLASTAGFLVAVWALVPLLGNHGLWLALILFLALRAVTLLLYWPRLTAGLAGTSGA